MAKVLVTGGAGFIGSHLVDRLIKDGHQVTVIDNLSAGAEENINPEARFVKEDIRNLNNIKNYFKGQEYVFHLAAVKRIPQSIENPILVTETNIIGKLNVLLASKDAGVKRVVYSSSSSTYGTNKPPHKETMPLHCLSPYALTKHAGELYCKLFSELYDLDTVSLKYFNVYGPRMNLKGGYAAVIAVFLQQKIKGEPLTIIGDGEQKRDFTYVDDVVEATIKAIEYPREFNGEVINIGRGEGHTINQLARLISDKFVYLPPRKGEVRESIADNSKARKLLNWEPKISLEEGLKKIMTEWGLLNR